MPVKKLIIDPTVMTVKDQQIITSYLLKYELTRIELNEVCSLQFGDEKIQFTLADASISPLPSKKLSHDDHDFSAIKKFVVKGKRLTEENDLQCVKGKLVFNSEENVFEYKPITEKPKRLLAKSGEYHSLIREFSLARRNSEICVRRPLPTNGPNSEMITSQERGKDLFNFRKKLLESNIKLNEQQLLNLLIAITKVVDTQAHQVEVIHKDVKLDNFIIKWTNLEGKPVIKLIDYGFSKFKHEDDKHLSSGTVNYVSPEVIRHEGTTEKSDIYSLGIVFKELLMIFSETINDTNKEETREKSHSSNFLRGKSTSSFSRNCSLETIPEKSKSESAMSGTHSETEYSSSYYSTESSYEEPPIEIDPVLAALKLQFASFGVTAVAAMEKEEKDPLKDKDTIQAERAIANDQRISEMHDKLNPTCKRDDRFHVQMNKHLVFNFEGRFFKQKSENEFLNEIQSYINTMIALDPNDRPANCADIQAYLVDLLGRYRSNSHKNTTTTTTTTTTTPVLK